jgi:hypothetical protein
VLPLRYGVSTTFAPMVLTLTLAAEAGDDLGHLPGIPDVSSPYDFVDRWVDAPGRKRANFQELAAEGLMTKEELRSKLDTLEPAREEAERELRLAHERSERLSALEQDAQHRLETYKKWCVEALADLLPEERREVYRLLDLTVEAHPDGRLEAAWALNASVSNVRPRSR